MDVILSMQEFENFWDFIKGLIVNFCKEVPKVKIFAKMPPRILQKFISYESDLGKLSELGFVHKIFFRIFRNSLWTK